ncbi:MAG: iron(III) transport system permease protein [Limisphaerales bacterium]|jgi:iron(III) transport system permease protein
MSWGLLLNSLVLAVPVALAAVVVGWFVALFIASSRGRVRWAALAGAIVSLALPPFLVVNTWLGLLGNVGVLKSWLPLDIYSHGGAAWVLTLMLWPLPCLMCLGPLKRLTAELLDAEPGLCGMPLVRSLLLPMTLPAALQSGLVVFALAFNNIAVPAILQVKVFPAQFWVQFSTSYNFALAWQYGWVLAALPLGLLLLLRGRAVAWPWESQGIPAEVLRERLGQVLIGTVATVAWLFICLSVLLPLGHLLFDARTWTDILDAFRAGQRAVWNSFWYSAATATLVSALGFVAVRWTWLRLAWLLFFLPGVLLGVVLIFLLNRPGLGWLYSGPGIVLLAFGLRYFALGWEGMRLAKASLDADLQTVTDLAGLPWWQRWRHLFLPQAGLALAATWYVVYLLCLWDTETLVLVVPPGGETLALRVFNLLHYGHHAQVNALCLILLLLAVLPLVFWAVFRLLKKKLTHD